MSGVAYYTVERDGFRVVATLAKKDEDAVPVRVVVVLAPGQSMTLSTPHKAGIPPDSLDFVRRADTVLVHKTAASEGRLIGRAAELGKNNFYKGEEHE